MLVVYEMFLFVFLFSMFIYVYVMFILEFMLVGLDVENSGTARIEFRGSLSSFMCLLILREHFTNGVLILQICEIFKKTSLYRTPLVTASEKSTSNVKYLKILKKVKTSL